MRRLQQRRQPTIDRTWRTALRSCAVAVVALAAFAASLPRVASAAAPAGAAVVVASVAPAPPLAVSVAIPLSPVAALPGGKQYSDMRDAEFAATVEKALAAHRVSIAKQLQADLFVALLKSGFAASTVGVERRGGADGVAAPFLRRDQLPRAPGAHAIVDVRILKYGFNRFTSLSQYGAYLELELRSVDPATGTTRYVRRYLYDRGTKSTGFAADMILVPVPSTSVTFASRDAIAADPKAAADALREASREVAAAIAAQL